MRTPRRVRVPEKAEQAQIVRLLRTLGAQVWVLGTRRPRGDYQGTHQTPGLPDVCAFHHGRQVWIEVKAAGGRLRPAQQHFRDCCARCGVAHVVGGLDAVCAWLIDEGLLKPDALSAERRARLEA